VLRIGHDGFGPETLNRFQNLSVIGCDQNAVCQATSASCFDCMQNQRTPRLRQQHLARQPSRLKSGGNDDGGFQTRPRMIQTENSKSDSNADVQEIIRADPFC
jgi:hypothetical protein